ncbi:MAG: hypothetical protein U0736_15390 [Gemmataceae bacterium]
MAVFQQPSEQGGKEGRPGLTLGFDKIDAMDDGHPQARLYVATVLHSLRRFPPGALRLLATAVRCSIAFWSFASSSAWQFLADNPPFAIVMRHLVRQHLLHLGIQVPGGSAASAIGPDPTPPPPAARRVEVPSRRGGRAE